MTPTILRTAHYRFVIHTRDHLPAHVHVYSPSGHAKFELIDVSCLETDGLTFKELRRLQNFIRENKEILIQAWKEIHDE